VQDTLEVVSTGLQADLEVEDPLCSGGADGIITVHVSAGSAPYTYLWSNGATESALQSVPAGNYQVTVTDVTGCIAHFAGTIFSPAPISIQYDQQKTSDGTFLVQVEPNGGTPPYSYQWNDGQDGAEVELMQGTYVLTVTDDLGCQRVFEIKLDGTEGHPLSGFCQYNDLLITDCSQQVFFNAPEIDTNVIYSVVQINGFPSGSVFPLGMTEVAFMIRFASGDCHVCSFNVHVLPDDPEISIQLPSCPGIPDGMASLEGSYDDYCISWNDSLRQTGTKAIQLHAGTYLVRGINSQGCFFNRQVILPDPQPLVMMNSLVADASEDQSNGQIQITSAGGSFPCTYHWTGPGGFISDQEDLYQIPAGEYHLVITDASGCSAFFDFTVNQTMLSSVEERNLDNQIRLFPNPNNGRFTIVLDLPPQQSVRIDLIDQLGRLMDTQSGAGLTNHSVDLTIPARQPGIYYLRIWSNNISITRKVTVIQ
ncbi:MAG: T9SS type A sorting domain-containing protein, partial [Saprospiraceae bacterium]|nr:T9SS type A sorting domain-containing protein [Saprospiraceae bacterium]